MNTFYKIFDTTYVVSSVKYDDSWYLIDENDIELQNIIQNQYESKILINKIQEAKAYLASTDYKVLPDYDKPDAEIVAKRQEAREFIRANEESK